MTEPDATRTVTALFHEQDEADRVVEKLVAAGVTRDSIAMRAARSGDVAEGGLTAALDDFLMPETTADAYGENGRMVVVSGLSPDLSATVQDILQGEAADIHELREETSGGEKGAIGTPGGEGRATGDTDRLTGEPIGGD